MNTINARIFLFRFNISLQNVFNRIDQDKRFGSVQRGWLILVMRRLLDGHLPKGKVTLSGSLSKSYVRYIGKKQLKLITAKSKLQEVLKQDYHHLFTTQKF